MADTNNNHSNQHEDDYYLDPSDGEIYIKELRDHLLHLMLSALTIEEVDNHLRRLYPQSNLIEKAIEFAIKSCSKQPKNNKYNSGALFGILSIVSGLIKEGVAASKSENEVAKYKAAIIEHIIQDALQLTEKFVRRHREDIIITRNDMRQAMHADTSLSELFLREDRSICQNHPILKQIFVSEDRNAPVSHQTGTNRSYKQQVRHMIDKENSFIRSIKMITKVFQPQLERLTGLTLVTKTLFCDIDNLLELSILLLATLEEALHSVDPEAKDDIPFVGSGIHDLAQAEEFNVYLNFAYKRIAPNGRWKEAYDSIMTDEALKAPENSALHLAIKHLLPNYLLHKVVIFFEYYRNICHLYNLSKHHNNQTDELALKETISILNEPKKAIETLLETELNEEIEPIDEKQREAIEANLDRMLDAELQNERNMPLILPPPEIYRFSEPDSSQNIIFEDFPKNKDFDRSPVRNEAEIPVIRCATLIKLVERLTYHKYQPTIVDCFLKTYRSFISDPEELLDLLIERFKIPDPPITVFQPNFNGCVDDLPELERNKYRQYLRRFRQEYSKPVKVRVINVLKLWVKNFYYDFERHPNLLNKLNAFLDEVYQNNKVFRSLINSLKKTIEQKKISQNDDLNIMHSKQPPPILWQPSRQITQADFPDIHPEEFARQLTLVQFELFRAIKPSELINVRDLGLRTKKEDKYESSPNLSRMTKHFTLFSYWVRKCIVEEEDLSSRASIYNKAIEIMYYLRKLNNFTGLLSIGSAIESAPIVRLSHTKNKMTTKTRSVMDDYMELNNNHQKKLQLELKSCNPPCIPYLGSYQTKLIHAKEGNKTFIDDFERISPTLSNDDFQSSFSNSPATPISPRTPLPRTTPSLPPSATSTLQNQFFASPHQAQHRPTPINISNNNFSLLNDSPLSPSFLQQPPQTPAPPKMINFTKQMIRAKLVNEISNYQNQPYCLTVQPMIRYFIETIEKQVIKFASSLRGADLNGDSCRSSDINVPALTKRLDDYLFEQSEKIEPKNSARPTKLKSKPDSWKSPSNR